MLTFQIPNSPLFSEQLFNILVSEVLLKGAFINVLNIFIYGLIYFKNSKCPRFGNVVRLFYGHFTCFGRHILSKYFNFDWRKRRKDEKRKPTKVFIVYSFLFIILFTRLSNNISVNHTSSDNWFLYWWVLFL